MVNKTNFETIKIDDFIHDPINQSKVQSYPPELVGRFNSFIVTAFDDSMTVEMQIRTLIKWIKENIDVTMSALDNMEAFKQDSMAFQNHVKDTLVNLINNFTDKFDDNLKFETQEILNQWLLDGVLSDIIRNAVNEEVIEARGGKDTLGQRLDETDDQLAQISDTLGQRLDETDDKLAQISNILPISVTDLGVSNTGEDSTVEMQLAIDSYEKLYIPDGKYSFSDLTVKSNTKIIASKNANIDMFGQIKNTLYNQSDETNKISIVGAVKRGSYSLKLVELADLSIGDVIQVYDGGWLSPEYWLEHSKNEDADWWNKHHIKITKIDVEEKIITLDSPIEFDIPTGKGSIVKLDFDTNITIQGGVWNIKHYKSLYQFKFVKGLFVHSGEYYSTTANALIHTERCMTGRISDNKIQFNKNAVIQLFHFTSRFDVSHNIIEVNDVFSGDGAIQLYSYANNNIITDNILTQKHVEGDYNSFMMGIALHTCQNNVVKNNVVHGFYFGLASYFGAKYNKFIGNETAYSLISGFYVHQSWYTDIIDNIIHSNGLYDNGGGWVNPQRAGITMQYTSNKINVRGNTFHHNTHDILLMDNADSWKILENNSYNTYGDFIRISKSAQAVDERIKITKMNVSDNTYIPKEKKDGASFINNQANFMEHNIISNNIISKTKNAFYLYYTSKFNLFSGNFISNTTTGFIMSYESKINRFIGNTFDTVELAYSMGGQSKLNIYKENLFTNVTTEYNFTDDFNFSLDNNALRATAPLGYRIPSIQYNSNVEYMERFKQNPTGTAINEPDSWRTVSKNIV